MGGQPGAGQGGTGGSGGAPAGLPAANGAGGRAAGAAPGSGLSRGGPAGGRGASGGGLNAGGGLGGDTRVAAALTTLLRHGSAGYRWAAATVGSESAAPLELASGSPVMAIGGFNGTDAYPTLAQFQRLVAAGEIHYFVGANRASFGGGSGPAFQITAWVRSHFTAKTVGGDTVYDLTSPSGQAAG